VGLYDRGYYRDGYEQEPRGFSLSSPRSVTVALILVNVALFLLNFLFFPQKSENADWLTRTLSITNLTVMRPWLWWQFLTYGFVHANVSHIFYNMLGFFFLGRSVEEFYGSKEYLRFYLISIVVCSVIWAACLMIFDPAAVFQSPKITQGLLGASGAISGVVMLFILNNPRATLIMFPIPIPIKAWVVGVLMILGNIGLGLGQSKESVQIAWGVHLTGIAFAYLYFRKKWNFGYIYDSVLTKTRTLARPKLRVHMPEDEPERGDMQEEVDLILDKIHKQGESSLTKQERRILENYSKKLRSRRNQ
jgi:membrane associated rhomboid family serine protease